MTDNLFCGLISCSRWHVQWLFLTRCTCKEVRNVSHKKLIRFHFKMDQDMNLIYKLHVLYVDNSIEG